MHRNRTCVECGRRFYGESAAADRDLCLRCAAKLDTTIDAARSGAGQEG